MEKLVIYFLFPGHIFTTKLPYEVYTVLGSCVAVCLWDRELKIGGMNHFMLPTCKDEHLPCAKYGDYAIGKLIASMLELGCKKESLEAKVFGGANQLTCAENSFSFPIGKSNIQVATQTLHSHNILIISSNTGGSKGRKLRFNTATGKVLMKLL